MQKNKVKTLMGSAILIAASYFSMSSASAYQSASQWLLIDERIGGEKNNLSSQLLFADKNSLSGSEKEPNISISNLNFSEEKIDGKFQLVIIDSRMRVTINCEEQAYKIVNLEQYDQDNIKVESPQIKFQIGQWQQAQSQNYQSLIEFSCNPDDGDYQQIFGPNIQPLQGLIGYLNADWSK